MAAHEPCAEGRRREKGEQEEGRGPREGLRLYQEKGADFLVTAQSSKTLGRRQTLLLSDVYHEQSHRTATSLWSCREVGIRNQIKQKTKHLGGYI